ncbi:hypothetical protein L3Q82_021206 [Scortum barcoo]|uniref:Uncharacterized protein n=1 Tax=Scortum barcoo TaxID=214431 RepID=A0ACB8X501_9TELE|nr:hypothetical protein L3Q82_021206 [Scortum barcoo]
MSLDWPGNASGSPGRAGGSVWGEGGLGISAQTAASATRSRTKRMKMDGWMDKQDLHRRSSACLQPACFSAEGKDVHRKQKNLGFGQNKKHEDIS